MFRTPTLLNVAETAPYFHSGLAKTLEEVVWFYNQGGGSVGTFAGKKSPEIRPLGLTEDEVQDLVEFLQSLTGKTPAQVAAEAKQAATTGEDPSTVWDWSKNTAKPPLTGRAARWRDGRGRRMGTRRRGRRRRRDGAARRGRRDGRGGARGRRDGRGRRGRRRRAAARRRDGHGRLRVVARVKAPRRLSPPADPPPGSSGIGSRSSPFPDDLLYPVWRRRFARIVRRLVGSALIAAAVALACSRCGRRPASARRPRRRCAPRRIARTRAATGGAARDRGQGPGRRRAAALNAALAAHVDSATMIDLLDNEDWWRPYREEFPLVRVIVGDTVVAARGGRGGAAVDAAS